MTEAKRREDFIARRLEERVVLGGRLEEFVPAPPVALRIRIAEAKVALKRSLLRSGVVRRLNDVRKGER